MQDGLSILVCGSKIQNHFIKKSNFYLNIVISGN